MWPASNAPLTNAEILALCDDEITGTLWPLLHSGQGDWHLAYADHAITSGQALYRLPSRTWGPIKDIVFVDGGQQSPCSVVNIEELARLGRGTPAGQRYVAYVDGDAIGLHPEPTATSGTLRIRYYRTPNALCLSADARQVVAPTFTVSVTDMTSAGAPLANVTIDTGSGYTPGIGDSYLSGSGTVSGTVVAVTDATHFQISRDNANLGTGTGTVTLGPNRLKLSSTVSWDSADVIGVGGSHQVQADELAISVVDGTIVTLTEDYPSNVAVGDWISAAGTTPLAQIPDHLVPFLVSRVSALALAAHGDQAGFTRAATISADLERRALPTVDPRNEAEPRVIIGRSSLLRRRR